MGTQKKSAKDLLKEIETDEREAFVKWEAERKAERAKKLAGLIKPLEDERTKLNGVVNDANTRLSEIARELSELTGTKQRGGTGGKRRQRKSAEEKLQIATLLVKNMGKGKEYSAGDLEQSADGVAVRQLIDLWNKANKDDKVKITGKKATTRYTRD